MNDNNFDPKNIPFYGLITVFYYMLSAVVVVASFGIAIVLMPLYFKRIINAATARERLYFCMRFSSMWCLFYAILMIIVFTIDANFGHWDMMNWWPTISWMLFDWNMAHANSVGCDVFLALVLVPVSTMAARMIGNDDRNFVFIQPPSKAVPDDAIESVMTRYYAALAADPKKDPSWATMHTDVRRTKMLEHKKVMRDIEDRVRVVHERYHRKCPI